MDFANMLELLRLPWRVALTGNMTLCCLDAAGLRIMKVDFVRQGTLAHGDQGERLARAYNDLAVVAACPCFLQRRDRNVGDALRDLLPHLDAGISAVPWTLVRSANSAKLQNSQGRTIAVACVPPWDSAHYGVTIASLLAVEMGLRAAGVI